MLLSSHSVFLACCCLATVYFLQPLTVLVPCRLQNQKCVLNFHEADVLRLLRALAAIIVNPDAGVCAGPGGNVSSV